MRVVTTNITERYDLGRQEHSGSVVLVNVMVGVEGVAGPLAGAWQDPWSEGFRCESVTTDQIFSLF